jgi:hypothetical protein
MLLLFIATSAFGTHDPRVYLVAIGGSPFLDDESGYDCGLPACFSPNRLTIVAGDVVMFHVTGRLGDTLTAEDRHNVVADDGSFRCAMGCDGEGGDGTPRDWSSAWYFTRTFDTPGIISYHDEISGARGVIIVKPDTDSSYALAVEYFYPMWNFYFVTASTEEIAALDRGAFGGVWKRTGQRFSVWTDTSTGAIPACRFFSTAFGAKSSHFYTPYEDECASLTAGATWQFETIAFYLQLPDADGVCAEGSIALYRLFNNGMGGAPNHRYTTDRLTLHQMMAAGWFFEGNEATRVFACVPLVV